MPEAPRNLSIQQRRLNSGKNILVVQWLMFDFEFYDARTSFRKFRLEYCVLSPEHHRLVNLALDRDIPLDDLQKESVTDALYRGRFTHPPTEATLFSYLIYDFGNNFILRVRCSRNSHSHSRAIAKCRCSVGSSSVVVKFIYK